MPTGQALDARGLEPSPMPHPPVCGGPPDPADGEVSVGAAGGRAGAGVVDVGHQGVGRRTDHGLEVDAGVR